MRTLTLALVAGLALPGVSAAQAADLDYGVLRGPDYETEVAVIDWSGVYVGGFAGYTSASLGHKGTFQPILADYFRARDVESEFGVSNLLAVPSVRVGGASYGAFAGYNYQFDDTVIGLEADYTRFGLSGTSADSIGRTYSLSNGIADTVRLAGTSTTKVEDFGTIRARAGYAIGAFLPFVTGGLAIGRATITDQVQVQNYGYDRRTYEANQALTSGSPSYVHRYGYASFNPNFPGNNSTPAGFGVQTVPASSQTLGNAAKTKVVGGIALGAGVEWALTQNIVLRGEYQYVLFNDFDGHKVNINTVRGGAAIKF